MRRLSFEIGIMFAAASLNRNHDQPGMAAEIIIDAGLERYNCKNLDDMEKEELRKINGERGIQLRGL